MPRTKKETTSTEIEVVPNQSNESNSIIPQDKQIVNFNAETLISQAIDKNVPVETMEKLLAMRRELKAEWAKGQFDKAMAAFQAECPTIVKTKVVHTKSGALAYKYAPIESIVEQVKPYLQRNGFSYSTTMQVLPAGVKVACKVTHTDGHNEITEMEVPLGERTQIMSASQVTAAASTFAKRYAFCNAFGILTGDEDNDGANLPKETESPAQTPNFAPRKPYNYQEQIKPQPSEHYLPLSARIAEATTEAELDLIANECRIAFTGKKLTQQDFTSLASASVAKRKELKNGHPTN